jgi:hypothetical protein
MGEILAKQIPVSTPQQEIRRKLTTCHLTSELMAARFKQRVNGRSSDWWNFGNRNRQEKLTLSRQLLVHSGDACKPSEVEDYRDRAELITGIHCGKLLRWSSNPIAVSVSCSETAPAVRSGFAPAQFCSAAWPGLRRAAPIRLPYRTAPSRRRPQTAFQESPVPVPT